MVYSVFLHTPKDVVVAILIETGACRGFVIAIVTASPREALGILEPNDVARPSPLARFDIPHEARNIDVARLGNQSDRDKLPVGSRHVEKTVLGFGSLVVIKGVCVRERADVDED